MRSDNMPRPFAPEHSDITTDSDIAAARKALEELEQGYNRYEVVRRLTPVEFKALWERNMRGEDTFDSLVDQMMGARTVRR